jgi:hypothetical protein
MLWWNRHCMELVVVAIAKITLWCPNCNVKMSCNLFSMELISCFVPSNIFNLFSKLSSNLFWSSSFISKTIVSWMDSTKIWQKDPFGHKSKSLWIWFVCSITIPLSNHCGFSNFFFFGLLIWSPWTFFIIYLKPFLYPLHPKGMLLNPPYLHQRVDVSNSRSLFASLWTLFYSNVTYAL